MARAMDEKFHTRCTIRIRQRSQTIDYEKERLNIQVPMNLSPCHVWGCPHT